ncbi:uncharacterized protein LOC111567508 [Amphiprion ocellaris]|uniref:BTB domain-containing protein n=1 Tax=Amphiprion ocellaris TaxID=80972 RepID=A0A3Q1CSI6_AMPOC|nr:uncharacterized protein LOC111567508 [Amphiprion ocellaris]
MLDIQRYRWPNYEMQLLGQLQRQQNSTQLCDTLLQTDGISIPTHSCVLAALSPFLSQKLSASPPPLSGQKRELQLKAVKAQTLLKLVGLMYSGELEVKGNVEQDDLLAAARQFGIPDLVEIQKDVGMNQGELLEKRQRLGSCRESGVHTEVGRRRLGSRKMRNAQVQTELSIRRDKSCVSTGTQTVKTGKKTMRSSVIPPDQTDPPTSEPSSSVLQSLNFSVSLQHQSIAFDKQPAVLSDGESTSGRSSESATNPPSTSASSSDTVCCHISLQDDSRSPRAQEDSVRQESSDNWNSFQVLNRERTGLKHGNTNSKTPDNGGNGKLLRQVNRDDTPGELDGNSAERRQPHANAGEKSLAKMKQMQQVMETTQISVKLKLRRRTKGEVWEVVSIQDPDETLSVLTSLKQDCATIKTPQTDLEEVHPPPSTVSQYTSQKLQTQNLQSATTSPIQLSHSNTTSESQSFSSGYFTPNQSSELEWVSLCQPEGSVDESDEQIERLLEAVMMGLNILPSLERDCKTPQTNSDEALSICQVSVTEDDLVQSQMHDVVSAAGCMFSRDLGTKSSHSPTDTAHGQPSYASLSAVQPDDEIQQQCFPLYDFTLGQSDGMSCQDVPPFNCQGSLYPQASTTSVMPSGFFSSEQKLHYPAFQQPSSQEHQPLLEFLPLLNGDETQSEHTFPFPCLDDLRLPPCLSPLVPCTFSTKHKPLIDNSINPVNDVQQQPLLPRYPWLTESNESLQFPLSAITYRENKSASVPQNTNHSCWSKQWQKCMELNQNGGTCAASCSVNAITAVELKSDPVKVKESLKCEQVDTTGDTVAPKRRKRKGINHPQDASSGFLACRDLKLDDGKDNFLSLSLSVNDNKDVLLKETSASSSNMPCRLLGKPNGMFTFEESVREKTRGPGDLSTGRARIRTRGFVKKAQQSSNNTVPGNSSVLIPVVCRAKIVNEQGSWKKKRGRPPKVKLEENPFTFVPAIIENKSHDVVGEQQLDVDLPKEMEDEKTKRRCKKRRRNMSGVKEIPLKNTLSAECNSKADNDKNNNNNDIKSPGKPKRPRMVTLKDIEKLIKRQRSITRKSKESQQANEPVTDVGSEMKASRDGSRLDESANEAEIVIDIEEDAISFNGTVDENHNQLFNKSPAQFSKSHRDDSSASEDTGLFGKKDHPATSFRVLEEDRETPLKNPDEGLFCGSGGSDVMQSVISNEGSSHSDVNLPGEYDNTASDQSSHLQTPEKTGPPVSEPDEEEEEEEEEEVDVLFYSPDNAPQSRLCEDGVNNMDTTADEEEENEIDVTGDEAE